MQTAPFYPNSKTFRPNRTSEQILMLVHAYFRKTGKHWSLMSQTWILEKLEEWYGYKIARSTLNYNLRILEEQGLIDRRQRHIRCTKTGKFSPRVTLYKATSALKKFFSRLAGYFKRCGWVPDIKALRNGYRPAVGAATTSLEIHEEYVRQKRRRGSG
ncbi:MAG: winged-helix domain-containing protein [Geobacteraceae bacterium]